MSAIRKVARGVAKNRMKKADYIQFCKHARGVKSVFSGMWRKAVGWHA